MYGNQIQESAYHPRISVIGAVETSQAGNVILRIGELWTDGSHKGWMQTEHVVLKGMEVPALISELLAATPKRYGKAFTFRIERDVAKELIKMIDGATAQPLSDDLRTLHDQLTEFATSP